ncbi:OmpA family protein [Flavobacteriaceae bacterium F08102]|nr:OmpA family protein [Flavobacteriaceae bacterium F08102]
MKKLSLVVVSALLLTACVSKKKYVALEQDRDQLKGELHKTAIAKDELEKKFSEIEARVVAYNNKINALKDETTSLKNESDAKFTTVGNEAVISNASKVKMRETLAKVDQSKLAGAKTLKDSMNLAVAYSLEKSFAKSNLDETEDIAIDIDETVVMISISDKLLFNTASYRVGNKANNILTKIAQLMKDEPSLDLMVEGHTDSRTIHNEKVSDNWDLSVLRATSVVRKLQNEFKVPPSQLIAAGRSSFQPLVENNSKENRAKNRRTRIVIMPNINKFFALMASNE